MFLSVAMFFGIAYAYLNYHTNNQSENVDQKDYTVSYDRTPQSCGLAFVFPDNSAALVYLDFSEENIRILNIENFEPTRPEYYGYTVDYTLQTSYELVGGIIDRVGGIDIEQNGEMLRYTGTQVMDLIAYGHGEEIKQQILLQIFDKISKNSFSKDDFVYIIENSESNLSFVDCIYWLDYLKSMSRRISFVN